MTSIDSNLKSDPRTRARILNFVIGLMGIGACLSAAALVTLISQLF